MLIYWLKHNGTYFPVHQSDCLMGRGGHCAVLLSSERASREHALVRQTGDVLEVIDLQSRNGTFVNGTRVHGRAVVGFGDAIQAGGERIEVSNQVETQVIRRGVDPAAPAVARRHVLELAEALILRGTESSDKQEMARVIYTLIEALRQNARHGLAEPSCGESARWSAVAQVVAHWTRDRKLDGWCQAVEQALG